MLAIEVMLFIRGGEACVYGCDVEQRGVKYIITALLEREVSTIVSFHRQWIIDTMIILKTLAIPVIFAVRLQIVK
ncbi:unnamed protein product, partial [Allacma fusca]